MNEKEGESTDVTFLQYATLPVNSICNILFFTELRVLSAAVRFCDEILYKEFLWRT